MIEPIYQEFERLEKNTVSFDIFDTLIIREHFWPKTVFNQVGKDINNDDYSSVRSSAEECARKRYSHLEEIKFSYLKEDITEEALSKEIATELATCIANPEIFKLYNKALQLGYKVIATSDMYLDETTLRKMLDNAGYKEISKIYVSSEYSKTKGSGSLFKEVLKAENIEVHQLIHIGDNILADVNVPSSLGICCFHYTPVEQQLTYNKHFTSKLIHSLKDSGASGGLLAYQLWKKWTSKDQEYSYWYRFGYNYTGPILMSFCHYLAKQMTNNSIDTLYFMSRDGELMQNGFNKMFPHRATQYLYASRRMYHFASITKLDDSTLAYLSAGIGKAITIKEYFERLCIDSDEARNIFFSHFENTNQTITTKKDKEKLYKAFIAISDFILAEAAIEKKALLTYLDEIGLLSKDPVAVVDIGWAASSQRYLEQIINKKLHGYYLGTHNDSYKQPLVKGFLFENGQPKNIWESFFSCIEIIELLFIGKHASIAKMEIICDKPQPVFLDISKDEQQRIDIAEEIHQGALDFIDEAFDLFKKWDAFPDATLINNLITSLIMEPSLEDITEIGSIPHNASIGNSSFAPIIDWPLSKNGKVATNSTYIKMLYNLVVHKKTPHIFWTAGLNQYFHLTKKHPLLASPVKSFITYSNSQSRPEKVSRNLYRYLKQRFFTSNKKKVLNITGVNNDWITCSGSSKIKWFEGQKSSYIDFDKELGIFKFKKTGSFNISGCIHVGKDIASKIYLYHLKKSLKIKSSFLVLWHDGQRSGEASIPFNIMIDAKKGESFFLSTPTDSVGIGAKVLCSPTHSYIHAYLIK